MDTMLDKLLAGERLWNTRAPMCAQLKKMKEIRAQLQEEHQAHLDDPSACLINTGVLLGALNLIDGLLKGRELKHDK